MIGLGIFISPELFFEYLREDILLDSFVTSHNLSINIPETKL